jgi:UDP-N-acetylglucosamine 2-epimerase (non-hydrolysing)
MILCVFGTTGELIKLMPVLVRLRDRGHPFVLASTGQQVNQIPQLLELAGLPPVDVWLAHGSNGRDLRTASDIPGWAITVGRSFGRERTALRRRLADGPGRPLVLVHGDTMTTLYGAVLGRLLRVPVAHIESGLRSFDLLHPFPEELNRRLTSRIARYLYAPGQWAASNLSRGTVIDTGSNTIRDALDLAAARAEPPVSVPDGEFGIASLHRFELLKDRQLLAETIDLLRESGRTLLWVDHPVTVAALEKHGLSDRLGGSIRTMPRLDFFGFVATMRRSSFLVTDSGGSQEETYYLDIPCLIHRKRTERREGLGENVVLSEYDATALRRFLDDPTAHRRDSELPPTSPSDVIVDDLEQRGFAANPPSARRGCSS